jgi:hypothetical protein
MEERVKLSSFLISIGTALRRCSANAIDGARVSR